jgi:hypothetical protein
MKRTTGRKNHAAPRIHVGGGLGVEIVLAPQASKPAPFDERPYRPAVFQLTEHGLSHRAPGKVRVDRRGQADYGRPLWFRAAEDVLQRLHLFASHLHGHHSK